MTEQTNQIWSLKTDIDVKGIENLLAQANEAVQAFLRLDSSSKQVKTELQEMVRAPLGDFRRFNDALGSLQEKIGEIEQSPDLLGDEFFRAAQSVGLISKELERQEANLRRVEKAFSTVYGGQTRSLEQIRDLATSVGAKFGDQAKSTKETKETLDGLISTKQREQALEVVNAALIRKTAVAYANSAKSVDERARRLQAVKEIESQIQALVNRGFVGKGLPDTSNAEGQAEFVNLLTRRLAQEQDLLRTITSRSELEKASNAALKEQVEVATKLAALRKSEAVVQRVENESGGLLPLRERIALLKEVEKLALQGNANELELATVAKQRLDLIREEIQQTDRLAAAKEAEARAAKQQDIDARTASFRAASDELFSYAQAQGLVATGGKRLEKAIAQVATSFSQGRISSEELRKRLESTYAEMERAGQISGEFALSQKALDSSLRGVANAAKEANFSRAQEDLFNYAEASGLAAREGDNLQKAIDKVAAEFAKGEVTAANLGKRLEVVQEQFNQSARGAELLARAQQQIDSAKASDLADNEGRLSNALSTQVDTLEKLREANVNVEKVRAEALATGQRLQLNSGEVAKEFERLLELELRRAEGTRRLRDAQAALNAEAQKTKLLQNAAEEASVTAAISARARALGLTTNSNINLRQAVEQVVRANRENNLTLEEQDALLTNIIKKQESLATVSASNSQTSGPGGVSQIGQVIALQQVATRLSGVMTGLTERFRDFEAALTQVRKTAGATRQDMQQLGRQLFDLGQSVPVGAVDLATIAGILGQLGAIDFTRTVSGIKSVAETAADATRLVAELTIATDLNAEEAATSFGQMQAVFARDVQRLRFELSALKGETADTNDALRAMFGVLNEISNSTVATVGDLNKFIRNFGGVATAAGLTLETVAALGGAIRDLGVMPQVAGTALSRLFAEMARKSEIFADALGITVTEWNNLFASDAEQAMLRFFQALQNASSLRKQEILNAIGAEQRLRNTLVKLADGYDLVEKNLRLTNDTAQAYVSIQDEAQKFSETLAATFQRLSNSVTQLADSFRGYVSVLRVVVSVLNQAVQGISGFIEFLNAIGGSVLPLGDIIAGLVGTVITLGAAFLGLFVAFRTLQFAGLTGLFRQSATEADKLTAATTATAASTSLLDARSRRLRSAILPNTAAYRDQVVELRQLEAAQGAVASSAATAATAVDRKAASTGVLASVQDASAGSARRMATGLLRVAGAASSALASFALLNSAIQSFSADEEGNRDIFNGVAQSIGSLVTFAGSVALAMPALKAAFFGVKAAAAALAASAAGVVLGFGAIAAGAIAAGVAVLDTGVKTAQGVFAYDAAVRRAAEGTQVWQDRIVNLFRNTERFTREVQNLKAEIAGDRQLDAALLTNLGQRLERAGLAAEEAQERIGNLAAGTISLTEATKDLRRTYAFVGNQFVATGWEIATEDVARFTARSKDATLALRAIGTSVDELRTNLARRLNIEISAVTDSQLNREATRAVESQIQVIRSQIKQALQEQGKGEEDVNKILEGRGDTLIDILEVAKELRVTTGFIERSSGRWVPNSAVVNAGRIRQEAAELDRLQRSITEEGAVLAETLKALEIPTLTFEDALDEALKGTIPSITRATELTTVLQDRFAANQAAFTKRLEDTRSAISDTLAREAVLESRLLVLRRSSLDTTQEQRTIEDQLSLLIEERGALLTRQRQTEQNLGADAELRLRTTLAISEATAKIRREEERRVRDNVVDQFARGQKILDDLTRQRFADRLSQADSFSAGMLRIEQELQDQLTSIIEAGIADRGLLTQIEQELRLQGLRKAQARVIEAIEAEKNAVIELRRTQLAGREQQLASLQEEARVREELLERQLEQASLFASRIRAFEGALSALTGQDSSIRNLFGLQDALKGVRAQIDAVATAAFELGDRTKFGEGIQAGLRAIDRESRSAARSLGTLIGRQEGLEQRLSNAQFSGDRGRAAQEFLAQIRRVSSDQSLAPAQREAEVAILQERLRQVFQDLKGQAPELDDLLSLSDNLLENEGKRFTTAQDMRKALSEQVAAAEEARLSEQERLRLYQRQQDAVEAVQKAQSLLSGSATRQDQQAFREQASSALGREVSFREISNRRSLEALIKELDEAAATAQQRITGESDADVSVRNAEEALRIERERNTEVIGRNQQRLEALRESLERVNEPFDALSESVRTMNVTALDQLANSLQELSRISAASGGSFEVQRFAGALEGIANPLSGIEIAVASTQSLVGNLSEAAQGLENTLTSTVEALVSQGAQAADSLRNAQSRLQDLSLRIERVPVLGTSSAP